MEIEAVEVTKRTAEPGVEQAECESSNVATSSNSHSDSFSDSHSHTNPPLTPTPTPTVTPSICIHDAAESVSNPTCPTTSRAAAHDVPKSIRGVVPGGSMPGATNIRGRPHGEVPEWVQRRHSISRDLPAVSNDFVASSWSSPRNIEGTPAERAAGLDLEHQDDIYVAEISSIMPQDGQNDDRGVLIIEGVAIMDPKHRRILKILGVFVVFSLIATGAGFITYLFTSLSRGDSIVVAGGGNENATLAPVSTPIISRGGNLSLTIGDVLSSISCSNGGIESFVGNNGAYEFFQEYLNEGDKNFTLFSASKQADTFGDLGIEFIMKALSPMYNGHVVSKTLALSP
jgi:hypothetical protein